MEAMERGMSKVDSKKKSNMSRDNKNLKNLLLNQLLKIVNDTKHALKSSYNPSIISQDLKIEGKINGTGYVEIEGSLVGEMSGNVVVIRETGNVDGNLDVESLVIRGKVEGIINAKTIYISSKAFVKGRINYQSLSVEDGASVDGEFRKISS